MQQAIYEREWAAFVDEIVGKRASAGDNVFRVVAADVLLLDQVLRLIDHDSTQLPDPPMSSPPSTPTTTGKAHGSDNNAAEPTGETGVQWYKRLRTPLARSAAKKMLRVDEYDFNSQATPAFKLKMAASAQKSADISRLGAVALSQSDINVENDDEFVAHRARYSVGSSMNGDGSPLRLEQTRSEEH